MTRAGLWGAASPDNQVSIERTVAPAVLPVTLAELKTFAKIDTPGEDDALEMFLQGAINSAERFTRRAFILQTWKMVLDYWPAREVELPKPPLLGVTSIKVYAADDTSATYDSGGYFVDGVSEPGRIVLRTGSANPDPGREFRGIEILYTAGYGTSRDDVPANIKLGILSWAANFWETRLPTSEPPPMAKKLLLPFKVYYL